MFTMTQKLGRLARMFGLLSLVAVLGGLVFNATPASAAPKGGGVLRVYVGNPANDVGIANATVAVQHLSSSHQIKGLTDAKGYFQIALAAGPYAVTAVADGYEAQQTLVSVKVGQTTDVTLRLSQNSAGVAPPPAPQPAFATPKSTLALHVVSGATGNTVANAAILVRDSAGKEVFKGASNAAGELKIELPQGKYVVVVEASAYQPAKIEVVLDNNPVIYADVKLALALSTSWPPPTDQ